MGIKITVGDGLRRALHTFKKQAMQSDCLFRRDDVVGVVRHDCAFLSQEINR